MKISGPIFIFFIISCANSYAEYFDVPLLKANWNVQTSKTSCELKQEIPLYGNATFIHRSGESLLFAIQEQRFKPPIIKASLSAQPSPWQQGSKSPFDYLVYEDHSAEAKNYGRLVVYGDTAESMIDALLQGQSPVFTYVRAVSDLDTVETKVAISAIKFLEPYKTFQDCRKHMLPFGLREIQDSIVFFDQGSKTLNNYALNKVNKIASYLKEIKTSKVWLGSETTIMRRIDKKWFSKRSAELKKAFIEQGISEDRIKIAANYQDHQDKNTIRVHIFGPDALRWLHYRKGNTRLTRTEKKRLSLLARYIQEYFRHGRLVINSHTDALGSKSANKKISRRRGDVIKKYLISQGVPEKQLVVKAFGESRPVKSNRTPKGRAQNRRVVLSFSS